MCYVTHGPASVLGHRVTESNLFSIWPGLHNVHVYVVQTTDALASYLMVFFWVNNTVPGVSKT